MKKRALIFGHTGQDGYYLTNLLKKHDIEVKGISRTVMDFPCDITNFDSVCDVLREFSPQYIFDFAAISTTSHKAYFDNHMIIGTGTANLLEAVRLFLPNACVFLAGSGLQFVNEGQPIREATPLDATSSYAAVRNYSYYLARYFRASYGLRVYYGFFFTHDSPRRSSDHMSQKIAMAARMAANGSLEKLEIGAVDVCKEYLFAGDAMEAVWTLVTQEQVHEVIIGNGEAHSIKEWAEKCFDYVGLDWRNYVTPVKGFIPEYSCLVSDPTLLRSLGWRHKTGFDDLVRMMMEAES